MAELSSMTRYNILSDKVTAAVVLLWKRQLCQHFPVSTTNPLTLKLTHNTWKLLPLKNITATNYWKQQDIHPLGYNPCPSVHRPCVAAQQHTSSAHWQHNETVSHGYALLTAIIFTSAGLKCADSVCQNAAARPGWKHLQPWLLLRDP